MPTGISPLRKRFMGSGATWPNASANIYGTNQVFYIPLWQPRYITTAAMTIFANAATQFISAGNRQRMVNNGHEYEIAVRCSDSEYFKYGRGTSYFDFYAAGLTGGVAPGGKCVLDVGDAVNYPYNYIPWVGSFLHEYAHAEDSNYFPPGQEPAGKAGLSIASWPEMITLFNDCQANGADPGANGGHFITSFRVPQRVEAGFGTLVVGTPVKYGAYGNISTLSGLYAFDGPTLLTNDRVLLAGQTNAAQSGIWLAQSGAWTRAADAMTAGVQYNVTNGTTNAGKYFTNITPGAITVGTTSMIWALDSMLSAAGPGTTGGTPASRVQRWKDICNTNGWSL